MSDLGRRIEALPPEKRAVLERQLLRRRGGAAQPGRAIPACPPGPAPLSFSQQRLWFLDQWHPGSPVYNAVVPMRLVGPLDVEALRGSLARIVERHDVLRTVFRLEGGEPVQVVLDSAPTRFDVIDLSDLPGAERHEEAGRLLREHGRRPFDLGHDTTLRATVVVLGDEDHLLQLEEHHIAFDGWSDAVLLRELQECYGALLHGREPRLPEIAVRYRDFAAWQRARLEGERLDELVSYWRSRLAGAPPVLALPTDRPRPGVQTFEGEHIPIALDAEAGAAIARRAQELGVTPYMLLYAAFACLLYRLTGQDDIVVGTPIANRDVVELEPVIGFFSNTVPLRLRLGGNPSFRELVSRARDVALGAYAHHDLPFERIVEAVRPERDASVNPLFQVNFRAQTGAGPALELEGLRVEPVRVDVGFSRFDLAVELQLLDDGVGGYLEYNVELFDRSTAAGVARAFEQLIRDLLESPERTLLEYELRPPPARRQARRSPALRGSRAPGRIGASTTVVDRP